MVVTFRHLEQRLFLKNGDARNLENCRGGSGTRRPSAWYQAWEELSYFSGNRKDFVHFQLLSYKSHDVKALLFLYLQ